MVSVIIPAYNASKFIRKTLDSVCRQTYRPFEIIAVDDGSEDNTADIIASYSNQDTGIKCLRQTNQGVAAARNLGIEHSAGEYIAPCDADDLWHPQKLEKQVKCIQASNGNVGLVYVWTEIIDEHDRVISLGKKFDIQGNVLEPLIITNFVGGGSTPLIKRSCIDKVGRYRLDFKQNNCQGAEDWDIYLRIAGKFNFKLVPSILVKYRITNNSMSHNIEEMIRSIELAHDYARRRYYKLHPAAFRKIQSHLSLMKSRYSNICGKYSTSMRFIWKAFLKNPVMIINPGVLRLFTKNILKISDREYTRLSGKIFYKASMDSAMFFYNRLTYRELTKLGVVIREDMPT